MKVYIVQAWKSCGGSSSPVDRIEGCSREA